MKRPAENGYFQKRATRQVIRAVRNFLYSPLGVGRFLPHSTIRWYLHQVEKIDAPLRRYFLRLGS